MRRAKASTWNGRAAADSRDPRGARWRPIIGLLPLAGFRLLGLGLALNVAIGVLPIVFIVGTSFMIQGVPAIARGEVGSWNAAIAALGVATAALILQNFLSPFQQAVTELVTRRVDGHAVERLLTATLSDAPMELLEEQDVLDSLAEARMRLLEWSTTPGAAAAALLALVARYTQMLVAVVVVALVVGPFVALVVLLCAMVARAGNRGSLSRWARVVWAKAGDRRRVGYVFEVASDPANGKEMRVLGMLDWWKSRGRDESEAYNRSFWHERRRMLFGPFIGFSLFVLVGATIAFVDVGAQAPKISVLAFALAIQSIMIPLRFGVFFPECDNQTEVGGIAWNAITGLEARAAELKPVPVECRPCESMPRKTIRFESVGFTYRGGLRPVLDGLDLEFEAGKSTAIVGFNGAGKTTLVKLLAGLYEPQSGAITVDGIPLSELEPRAWRRRLAVIFQDFVRYELDAATNIALGAPDKNPDPEVIMLAARRAGAAEFISELPAGLSTPLSSRFRGGVDLSGGQWQRIALARALYAVEAGAGVLILDEPTAQLDVRAEVAFFDRFLELTHGLTTLVISHRFSTVRRADRIVVLDGGRVTEQGSHKELLALGGRYAELFNLQAKRFQEADGADGELLADGDLAGVQ
jgi:ATP-binding cassette subfamily B protein